MTVSEGMSATDVATADAKTGTAAAAASGELDGLLLRSVDLDQAGLGHFAELAAPSSDEDPPPMTGPTPETTALLNRTFTDKPPREVRTSFATADSSVVVDEGISERAAGAAAAWMADMRQVYARCAAWTVRVGDQEFPVRVVNPADDPSGPLDRLHNVVQLDTRRASLRPLQTPGELVQVRHAH
ncbi:hypothetical protein, partial [Streptomyces sp. NPDC047123]|uniref:hypothetical protein n=1 Tax=Streptomyces sp. NPDC047123 TaxID=3155622 RepID=UPI003407231F